VTMVEDLELPLLDTTGLDRAEALSAVTAMAQDSWIARTDLGYAVLHYADVSALLRDRRFHSALAIIREMNGLEDDGFMAKRRKSILSTEGDEHTRLRRLVSPAFTPASADRHRPVMQRVIRSLLEPHLEAGRVELVAEICEPYPIPVICEVLGAPAEDWRLFSDWATGIFKIFNGNLAEDLPDIEAASTGLAAYVAAMVDDRRGSPGDDLLSDLIAVEEEGDRLSTEELAMLAEAVLMAGTDTTRNQLGCAMALFAQHPEQWALLVEKPALAPRAVEETMRYLGAVRATVRVASCDIDFKGVTFPKGTVVTTHLGAANRDEEIFSHPGVFDLEAERRVEHLSFGSGIHRCLGAALARAELQEALTIFAESFETVALDGEIGWKPPTFGIWGPSSLPLRFTRRGS